MIKIVRQTDEFPSGTSGTITIPSTAPGNVLIILAVTSAGTGAKWTAPNFISSSDGIFTEVPFYSLQAGVLWDWGSFAGSSTSSDVLYQVTSGGVTTISYNTNIQADMICVREVSGLVTPIVVDDFKLNGSASGLVVGSALAGAGVNDLCFENFATFNFNIAGSPARNPWQNDMGLSDLGGSGALLQLGVPGTQTAPAPVDFNGDPVMDQYTCTSVAFKGVGLAPTTPVDENSNPVTLKYAFDDNFNLIVGRFVDTNNKIHSFPFLYSNDYTGSFDPFQAADQQGGGFGCPWGFTCLSDRLFYVADECNGVLWEVDIVTGICTRIAGGGDGSGFPNGLAVNWNFGFGLYTVKAGLDGNLYLGVPNYETIVCINMQNHPINVCGVAIPVGFAAEVAGTDTGQGFQSDYSVCADASGNVYACEEGNSVGAGNKVWKTDSLGIATLIAGTGTASNTGDGGPANLASVDAPLGLAIDLNNILYVVCNGDVIGTGAIRAINLSGVTRNVCGKTIAPGNIDTLYDPGAAQTNFWACQPDYDGNLLVCDIHGSGSCESLGFGGHSRAWMHKIDAAGIYSLLAGSATGVCGFSGDGGPPLSALIGTAFGAAVPLPVPPAGNIIVTKTTVPFEDGVNYTFRPSWGAPFTLIDGGSHDSGPLAPGVYSITEDPAAGVLTTVNVSNGDPPNAIVLAGGGSNLIQKASGVGSATFANPTQPNSAIIVVYAFNDTSSSLAPTDDKGNAYQLFSGTPSSPNNDGSGAAEIWFLPISHLTPVTAGVIVVTGHADPLGTPHVAPFVWIYEVRTNQVLITDAPTDIECINFGPADLNPNIPTPGFTGLVGQDSTNPSATGDFCLALCLVGPHGGTVTGVDAPWTLDTVQGGNAPAYTFLPNGVDTPVSFHQSSAVAWSISQGCFTSDIPAGETVTVAFLNSISSPAPPGGTSFIKKKAPAPGTIQVVPLDNSPNQVWGVTVKVDDQSLALRITLRYNELAKYWTATIKDKKGNVLLDSLPFITGTGISQNLLGQFVHLALGSATVFNASSLASDRPDNQNLGKDFLLIWGDTPVEENDVVTSLVVVGSFPPGGETPPPPPPPPPPGPPSPVPGDLDVLTYATMDERRATMHLNGSAQNGSASNNYSFIDPATHSFAWVKSNAGWANDILLYYSDVIKQVVTELDDADHRLWSDNRAYKKFHFPLAVMPRFITPGAPPTVLDFPSPNLYDRLINCLVVDTKNKGDSTTFTHSPVIMNLDSWGAGGGNIGPVSVILNERFGGKFARERFYLGLNLGLLYWDVATLTSGLKFTGTYTVTNWSAHNKLVAGGGVASSFGCGYGVGWP